MSKEYPREFFAWAYEHGFPERGPRGSEINKVRAKMLPSLHSRWLEEQHHFKINPVTSLPSVYSRWLIG
jgi:hypothetical protein